MAQHRRFHTPAKLLLLTLISFSPGGAAFAQVNPSAEKNGDFSFTLRFSAEGFTCAKAAPPGENEISVSSKSFAGV